MHSWCVPFRVFHYRLGQRTHYLQQCFYATSNVSFASRLSSENSSAAMSNKSKRKKRHEHDGKLPTQSSSKSTSKQYNPEIDSLTSSMISSTIKSQGKKKKSLQLKNQQDGNNAYCVTDEPVGSPAGPSVKKELVAQTMGSSDPKVSRSENIYHAYSFARQFTTHSSLPVRSSHHHLLQRLCLRLASDVNLLLASDLHGSTTKVVNNPDTSRLGKLLALDPQARLRYSIDIVGLIFSVTVNQKREKVLPLRVSESATSMLQIVSDAGKSVYDPMEWISKEALLRSLISVMRTLLLHQQAKSSDSDAKLNSMQGLVREVEKFSFWIPSHPGVKSTPNSGIPLKPNGKFLGFVASADSLQRTLNRELIWYTIVREIFLECGDLHVTPSENRNPFTLPVSSLPLTVADSPNHPLREACCVFLEALEKKSYKILSRPHSSTYREIDALPKLLRCSLEGCVALFGDSAEANTPHSKGNLFMDKWQDRLQASIVQIFQLYLAILPIRWAQTFSLAQPDTNGAECSIRLIKIEEALSLITVLQDWWVKKREDAIMGGPLIAIRWVSFIPPLVNAFIDVTKSMAFVLSMILVPENASSEADHANVSRLRQNLLLMDKVQKSIGELLRSLLLFDEEDFDQHRSIGLPSLPDSEKEKDGAARPSRGKGRSLLRKEGASEEGVLLAQQIASSSSSRGGRFTSRNNSASRNDPLRPVHKRTDGNGKAKGVLAPLKDSSASLFPVLVKSPETVPLLSALFSRADQLGKISRYVWLDILVSTHSLIELLLFDGIESLPLGGTGYASDSKFRLWLSALSEKQKDAIRLLLCKTQSNLSLNIIKSLIFLEGVLFDILKRVWKSTKTNLSNFLDVIERDALTAILSVGASVSLAESKQPLQSCLTHHWFHSNNAHQIDSLMWSEPARVDISLRIMNDLVEGEKRLRSPEWDFEISTQASNMAKEALRLLQSSSGPKGELFLIPSTRQTLVSFMLSTIERFIYRSVPRDESAPSVDLLRNSMKESVCGLMDLLCRDIELLLISCTASFLHHLVFISSLLMDNGKRLSVFLHETLVPTLLPVILFSLRKSRQVSSPRNHTMRSENALFLLSGIAKMEMKVRSHVRSLESSDSSWTTYLAKTITYCMRIAGRGGFRLMKEYGLPSNSLPEFSIPNRILEACPSLRHFFLEPSSTPPLFPPYSLYDTPREANYLDMLDESSVFSSRFHRARPARSGNSENLLHVLSETETETQMVIPAQLQNTDPSVTTEEDNFAEGKEELNHLTGLVNAFLRRSSSDSPSSSVQTLPFTVDESVRRVIFPQGVKLSDTDLVVEYTEALQWYSHVRRARSDFAKNWPMVLQHQFIGISLQPLFHFLVIYLTSSNFSQLRSLSENTSAPSIDSTEILRNISYEGSMTLLDFMSYHQQANSWRLLRQALAVTETPFRIGRQNSALDLSFKRAALTSILSIIKSLQTESSPSVHLQRSVHNLSRIIAHSQGKTLLGLKQQKSFPGLLPDFPSRDEYRTFLYAVKQAVLSLQLQARAYCVSAKSDITIKNSTQELENISLVNSTGESAQPNHNNFTVDSESPSSYYKSRPSDRPDRQMVLFCYTLSLTMQFCLEFTRSHALSHEKFEEDLRLVLSVAIESLCQQLKACIDTFVQLENATQSEFMAELYVLLWCGMSVAASMSSALKLGDASLVFRVGTLDELTALTTSLEQLAIVAKRHAQSPPNISQHRNPKEGEDLVFLMESYPFLGGLVLGMEKIVSCFGFSSAVSAFGLSDGFHSDVGEVIHALYVLCSSTIHSPPALKALEVVWESVKDELMAFSLKEAAASKTQKGGKKSSTTLESRIDSQKGPTSKIPVRSLDDVRETFNAFNKLTSPMPHTSGNQTESSLSHYSLFQCDVETILLPLFQSSSANSTRRNIFPNEEDLTDDTDRAGSNENWNRQNSSNRYWSAADDIASILEFRVMEAVSETSQTEGGVSDKDDNMSERYLIMDTVIAHGSFILSVLREKKSATELQIDRLLMHQLTNLIELLKLFSLRELLCRPKAHFLMESLRVFTRTMEGSANSGTQKNLSFSSKMRDSSDMTSKIRTFWHLLGKKWREELLAVSEGKFMEYQAELLSLIARARECFSNLNNPSSGKLNPEKENEADGVTREGGSPYPREIFHDTFLSHDEINPLCSLYYDMKRSSSHMFAGEDLFPLHDDIRCLNEIDSADGTPQSPLVFYKNVSRPPILPQPVPLRVTYTLLVALLSGNRQMSELVNLADVVCTYIMRQYAYLRPRLEKTAMNVVPIMYNGLHTLDAGADREPSSPNAKKNASTTFLSESKSTISVTEEVQDWWKIHLPGTSLYAESANGALFSNQVREYLNQVLNAAFSVAGGIPKGKEEEYTYRYIRLLALYLHLLSTVVAVLSRYSIRGTSDESAAVQIKYRRMLEDHNMNRQISQEWAKELRVLSRRKQTVQREVNDNLLEHAVLHFANVGCILLHHTDVLTHTALQRIAENGTHQAVLSFSDELRALAVSAFQDGVSVLIHSPKAAPAYPLRIALQLIISEFPCLPLDNTDPLSEQHSTVPSLIANNTVFATLYHARPELFVTSPSRLAIISPRYYAGNLTNVLFQANNTCLIQVLRCFVLYMARQDAELTPILSAITHLITTSAIHIGSLHLFCEKLCKSIVSRESFRHAIELPTVASSEQGRAEVVPNEILISFLAALSRRDVQVTKATLAKLLYTAMSARKDIFGQPPTSNRQAKLSLIQASGLHSSLSPSKSHSAKLSESIPSKGKVSDSDPEHSNEEPLEGKRVEGKNPSEELNQALLQREGELILNEFTVESNALMSTHQKALAALHLSLPAAMEVAMHFSQRRFLSADELSKARAMLRAADDARAERVALYQSTLLAAQAGSYNSNTNPDHTSQDGETNPFSMKVDAALRIQDPIDYAVAVLHIQFALRKIIHAAFRRLATKQAPRTLACMMEMLKLVDPAWPSEPISSSPGDRILSGTIRILLSESILSAESVGLDPKTGEILRVENVRPEKNDRINSNNNSTFIPILTSAPSASLRVAKNHPQSVSPSELIVRGVGNTLTTRGIQQVERALATVVRLQKVKKAKQRDRKKPKFESFSQKNQSQHHPSFRERVR